jgi:hypothetical protein
LLKCLIPLSLRNNEPIRDLVARYACAKAKELEVRRISAALAKERQFNRKAALNATLRQLRSEFEGLTL